MKFFNGQTGQMEEIETEEKSYFQMWLARPRQTLDSNDYLMSLFLRLVAAVLVTLIVSITAYNMHYNALNTKIGIEQVRNGYCQVAVGGIGGAVWQKCK